MADVFISYKRRLRPRVEALAARLREHGFEVWFDASLNAGESFSDEIARQVRGAKCVLVCWTDDCFPHGNASADEGWVRQEADVGLKRGVLVPVFAEDTDLDPPFRNLHTEDLRNWLRDSGVGSDDDPNWRRVLDAIGRKTGRRVELPPPAPNSAATPVRPSAPTPDVTPARERRSPLPVIALGTVVVVLALLAGTYFLFPRGNNAAQTDTTTAAKGDCTDNAACAYIEPVLRSTGEVWRAQFAQGRLPRYSATAPEAYVAPTPIFYTGQIATGCGDISTSAGPFYCPADGKLYIDPGFYELAAQRVHASGNFAQAYAIAHAVSHRVQNLIGYSDYPQGETSNQTSVRIELQADCFAGVWAHTAQSTLVISDTDLREVLSVPHNMNEPTDASNDYTQGTAAQRMRWFRRGFNSGDARQCDTFGVMNYSYL